MSMKWMGCLNHDLPYSMDEKPRERRETQNWRAPTEKRETKKSLVFHKPFTTYNDMVDIAIIMTDG